MRSALRSSLKIFSLVLVAALCLPLVFGAPERTRTETAKLLPDKIGAFRADGSAQPYVGGEQAAPFVEVAVSSAVRRYAGPDGHNVVIEVFKTQNDAGAFSLLTLQRRDDEEVRFREIGTASLASAEGVFFSKGNTFVRILPIRKSATEDELLRLARSLAGSIDAGENEIPILVKHLPNWENAGARSLYSVTLPNLKRLVPDQLVLDSLSFETGAEAVVSTYPAGTLLIVESNTPQISAENDRHITAKLQELRGQGEAVPSAYRRVGNYSVFVFGAPSEQVANELIDQVKYQQVVQWLGNDPYAYERATRAFTETTLGVFVSVVKASGLALVMCFALGGFLGALLFNRRRAQKRNAEAYSDAGGMVRLNIDEMTRETDPARLLGPGMR